MPQITDYELRPDSSIDGSEEYVVDLSGVTYKVNGSGIVKAVTDQLNAYIASTDNAISNLQTGKLDKSGGTMTGLLTLSGTPTSQFHASTKKYVDDNISGLAPEIGASFDNTSTAVTQADTVENTTLATTEYVGNKIEYETRKKTIIASTPYSLTEALRGVILVNHTTAAATVLNLPQISTLINPDRVEYTIIDSGLNANTNNITINAFAGDSLDSGTSTTITANGASRILICNSINNTWYFKSKDQAATSSSAGTVELATTAEAEALSSSTVVLSPSTAGDILDLHKFQRTAIAASPHTATAAQSGILGVTVAGAVTINLPAISSLTEPQRVRYTIVDERGSALTGNITVDPNGGELINGATTRVITDNYGAITIYNNGTNWFIANDKNVLSIGAAVYRNANQSINDATETKIQLDTEVADNQGQFDNAVNYRFTATHAGSFLANLNVGFAASAFGLRYIKIMINGTTVYGQASSPGHATISQYLSCSAQFGLAVGDYVEAYAYQSSGGALNVLGGISETNFFITLVNK